MKRVIAIILLLATIPSVCCANGILDSLFGGNKPTYEEGVEAGYEEGYKDGFNEGRRKGESTGYQSGYDDGYDEGTENPFENEYDQAGAFGYWFISQTWTDQELHAWKAVFESMFDDKDRTEPYGGFKFGHSNPVWVAIVSGDVYHTDVDCDSLYLAYRVVELELSDAKSRGFRQCKKCK